MEIFYWGVYDFEFFQNIFKADDLSVDLLIEFDSNKKDPNITVEVSKKADISPTVWQYHLR